MARALTCEDLQGQLTKDDVEVDLEDYDPKRNIGAEQYDLQIIVFASDYPSRRKNLDARCQLLAEWLRGQTFLHGVRSYIWIRLAPAAFIEFIGADDSA